MKILVNLLVNGFAVFVTAYILPGIKVNNFLTAVIVAVVLGILNTLLKPVLFILTLPINILTLGLFGFILNGLIILLASAIVPGFNVQSIIWAMLFSIILTVINWFFGILTK